MPSAGARPCRSVCGSAGYTSSGPLSVLRITCRGGNVIYSNETGESSTSRPVTINSAGPLGPDTADHQRLVNERFRDRAQRGEEVYQREDLFSLIHQHRQARALDWIDGLRLPAGSQVLEVGPGGGFMRVELAGRGFNVQAADSTPRMVEIARRRVAAAGASSRVRLLVADAHDSPSPRGRSRWWSRWASFPGCAQPRSRSR